MTRQGQQASYLDMMGVQTWYAHKLLNAAPSPTFSDQADWANDLDQLPVNASKFAKEKKETVLESLEEQSASLEISNSTPQMLEVESVSERNASIEPGVEVKAEDLALVNALPSVFSLNVYQSDDVRLLSFGSDSQLNDFAIATSLVIARFQSRSDLNFVGNFRWPVFSFQAEASNTDRLLAGALQQFSDKMINDATINTVVLGVSLSEGCVRSIAKCTAGSMILSSSVSLSDCIRNPLLKAQLWADII
ncbi:hypothetical protein A3715_03415 [Oleiphilus sp. HI0009]|uniref:hypothetical protein n=1 Tax=unclassified Oleiphilus TaxID=2631174 RepID=UPI0007C268FF|nr:MULTISPECIES: hypothetical protein [unclassified Oleiphilus]KZX86461.1 hypothetical protein A3715_03415 [Oleiphilus sp. HI0009]KZY70496.1 hypothetical protein A3739_06610 [Oleiphilus sp. HI0067]KZY71677.1 hypothetical protein A3738_14630 [Oleiphilus sp. HI0066]KZZ62574.1 hypothetical protein A3762_13290 [Oleiphilus sp. HI0125]